MRLGPKNRYPFVTAVHWFAFNPEGKVLLLRRFKTGYMDGSYSVPAGHVDGDESVRAAMLREIQEEVGVQLDEEDLTFAHVMHRNQKSEPYERIDFFFKTENFTAEVQNCEPNKCDQLAWFESSNPPENMVEYVVKALHNVTQKKYYSEHSEG
ncbi:MAG: NUDIX domain-containing protein [Candidatus Pacebacteria bacterium]|nr:NUDIX domain-containing protein [Candidatus Paceibacterota bacterium]PIR64268.1 MAG: NUDIX hydrolase [Candidatus Pacebacteria bacterium CG10_big_fil_rev_8_21_14_0_10_40_26]PIZ78684.1 MAG: NUDIX hydrolase [Candidatus Pacebacteria bacterium CG_4_10_14_0_2_um_filter_40_20]PJA68464.1 MAG: NUDIX hydrolase [Candidatus Pacebacteria bacterium CG_4_9_14_3_um_filter_40_12]PJC41326.1 MAG: NUDIX hydrolase [Candidatus Pacebacteria bacterium CG_4_9_14_0_2_um_filter_40_15]